MTAPSADVGELQLQQNLKDFVAKYSEIKKENAEAQSFYIDLLGCYGLKRQNDLHQFEYAADRESNASGRGRIDFFWSSVLLAEHKSRGQDLNKAMTQAMSYVAQLEPYQRPKHVMVSDFARIWLQDLNDDGQPEGEMLQIKLEELPTHSGEFEFIRGRQRHSPKHEANVRAAEAMGKLHDLLKEDGYRGHQLRLLLTRLMFLMFGDSTGLWERGLFHEILLQHREKAGPEAQMGHLIGDIFQILDRPVHERSRHIGEELAKFPYVNGDLFKEMIPTAHFGSKMNQILLEASALNWSKISPAIFGSMVQSVMDAGLRRNLGAHYTSEDNIEKVLGPLFLDELWAEREKARGNKARLRGLRERLGEMRIFDPACGSGNFLLMAYLKLRELEIDILKETERGRNVLDVENILKVQIDQFFGIEIEAFPAEVARVAMWMAEHQSNVLAGEQLGQTFPSLPLKGRARILCADSLSTNWADVLQLQADPPAELYILGNPPFSGSSFGKSAKDDDGNFSASDRKKILQTVADEVGGVKNHGKLDLVAFWHLKAADLMRKWPNLRTKTSLVSTNSICQGEQVAPLWSVVLNDKNMRITAAHQSFKWSNEARGVAAVHCVIVQFERAEQAAEQKLFPLYTYAPPPPPEKTSQKRTRRNEEDNQPHFQKSLVTVINAYLLPFEANPVAKQTRPLSQGVQEMKNGSKPTDAGHLIFNSKAEKDAFLAKEQAAEKFIRPLLDAETYLNGKRGETRHCLWLVGASGAELAQLPHVMERVAAVKAFREKSTDAQTRKSAAQPTLFQTNRQPTTHYLLVPSVSSERRFYMPVGFMPPEVIANNLVFTVPDATLYTFAIVQSSVHMAWMRLTAGYLGTSYRYNATGVYNTFPWPENVSDKARENIEALAQAVLDERQKALDAGLSLAEIYNPEGLMLHTDLAAAHAKLDRAVMALYGIKTSKQGFEADGDMLAVLVPLHECLVGTLGMQNKTPDKPKKTRKPRQTKPKS